MLFPFKGSVWFAVIEAVANAVGGVFEDRGDEKALETVVAGKR